MLSPRQMTVLEMIMEGKRTSEISYALGIKPETVNMHIAKIRKKLNAKTNAEAVAIAIKKKLISLD